jgi:toxin ParE1/3/4
MTEAADADLADIWVHIAVEASEATATRFLVALEKSLDRVLFFPEAGASRDAFAPHLRATFHGSYVIYYRATEDELVVIRVLHGMRDQAAIADRGGFQ